MNWSSVKSWFVKLIRFLVLCIPVVIWYLFNLDWQMLLVIEGCMLTAVLLADPDAFSTFKFSKDGFEVVKAAKEDVKQAKELMHNVVLLQLESALITGGPFKKINELFVVLNSYVVKYEIHDRNVTKKMDILLTHVNRTYFIELRQILSDMKYHGKPVPEIVQKEIESKSVHDISMFPTPNQVKECLPDDERMRELYTIYCHRYAFYDEIGKEIFKGA